MTGPRIALIHATPLAVAPVEAAFVAHWPEAERVNLLEDSLSRDRARLPELTEEMSHRINALADYALSIGAAGILFTCSAFGAAINAAAARLPVPVLTPNEAMYEAARGAGSRLALVASFRASLPGMLAEFEALASGSVMTGHLAEGAMEALSGGDGDTHDRLLAEAAAAAGEVDAILLAQFSTARARAAVAQRTGLPVLTSPDSAVLKLKGLLGS